MDLDTLYREAMAADAAFSRELKRIYGADACEARYRYYAHADAECQTAMIRKLHADALWIEAMRS